MSASDSGMRGGQPSTTQPIAGPWLSPQVVTRNRWPKLLCDIGWPASRPLRERAGRSRLMLPSAMAMSGAAGFFMPTIW